MLFVDNDGLTWSAGVESVNVDGAKDLVTVKGTMEAKELTPYLKEKLKRNVEVVPPKKEEDKKDKEGGGEKKDKKEGEAKPAASGGGGGDAAKVEVNKMEYHGYPPPPPSYWYDGNFPGQTSYAMEVNPGYSNQGYQVHPGYANQGYMTPYYLNPHHPPPQMFSDENPNACSVM